MMTHQLVQLLQKRRTAQEPNFRSGVQVYRKRMKNLPSFAHVLQKTLDLVITRCCFAEDGKEMYLNVMH